VTKRAVRSLLEFCEDYPARNSKPFPQKLELVPTAAAFDFE